MSTMGFRSAVVAEIETWRSVNYPDLPVFYENGPEPEQDKVGLIWLDVSIRWNPSGAVLLTTGPGFGPRGRESGVVSLQLYHKEMEGTELPDEILDSLEQLLKARRLGGALMKQPGRYAPTNALGWYKPGLMVPFQIDRN